MKVLWLHNHYKVWGGESAAAEREARLLREAGVDVLQEAAHNDAIDGMGLADRATLPLRNAWSASSARRVRELCESFRPDVLHAHNVWPLLSPSVFVAARQAGVKTVFTAHNFYLFCLNGVFFRDGHVCTDCSGHLPWSGVIHRCYRGLGGSATRFAGVALHRMLGTFRRVDRILTPTGFAREHFLRAGFAEDRVIAKWLSCEDPLADGHAAEPLPGTPSYLVACRLVPEKGVHVLIDAAKRSRVAWKLRVAGDGPERPRLAAEIASSGLSDRIEILGHVPPPAMPQLIADSTAILVPSIWYETFGLTVIEAFGAARPVVASDIGALREVVDDASGLRVAPGDAAAWAATLDALATDVDRAKRMADGARARYARHFTPQADARRLLAVYERLTDSRDVHATADSTRSPIPSTPPPRSQPARTPP